MQKDGWIPREQILGAEAMERVPGEFLSQHVGQANPPTFLLTIERLMTQDLSASQRSTLMQLYPFVVKWFKWFAKSQSGFGKGVFRWRGRDVNDGKLNHMTLTSGLDDYPRAAKPSKDERHVDLLSWVIKGAEVMGSFATLAGEDGEAAKFNAQREELLGKLDELHWNDKVGYYCDAGQHSNKGKFKQFVVIKCSTADRSSTTEALTPAENPTNKCPSSHPQFMWQLGDGQGGLMMREK